MVPTGAETGSGVVSTDRSQKIQSPDATDAQSNLNIYS